MWSKPPDQDLPAIKGIAGRSTVCGVAVDCIVSANHEVAFIMSSLKPAAGGQHVATGCVESRLELFIFAMNRVQVNSRVWTDEHLHSFSSLLERDSTDRSRAEDNIFHDFAFVSRNVAFVDGNVSALETNRHVLTIFRYAKGRWLLKVCLDRAKAGRDRLVQLAEVPDFELGNRFKRIIDLRETLLANRWAGASLQTHPQRYQQIVLDW